MPKLAGQRANDAKKKTISRVLGRAGSASKGPHSAGRGGPKKQGYIVKEGKNSHRLNIVAVEFR